MNYLRFLPVIILLFLQMAQAVEKIPAAEMQTDIYMDNYLSKNKDNYALLYFVQPGCTYCQHQFPVMSKFQSQYGWYVKTIDIVQSPEVRSKFNVNATPVVVLIKKNGNANNWQTVSVGFSPLPTLSSDIFKLVQTLNGHSQSGNYFPRSRPSAATQFSQQVSQ